MSSDDWFKILGLSISGAQLAAVAFGAYWAVRQLKSARDIARFDLTLRLHDLLRPYDEIRRALLTNCWVSGASLPSDEEWYELQKYIGLLELTYLMIRDELAEVPFVQKRFRHRVRPIKDNAYIWEKLKREDAQEPGKWQDFFSLCEELRAK
jgi:hypothetical protein